MIDDNSQKDDFADNTEKDGERKNPPPQEDHNKSDEANFDGVEDKSGENELSHEKTCQSENCSQTGEGARTNGYRALGRDHVAEAAGDSGAQRNSDAAKDSSGGEDQDTRPESGGYRSIERPAVNNKGAEAVSPGRYAFEGTQAGTAPGSDEAPDAESLSEGLSRPFSFLLRPGFIAVAVIIISALAFFMAGQAVHLLGVIAGLPPVFRWVGWVGVWILLLASGGAFGYLIFMFVRLRASPGFVLPGTDYIDLRHIKRNLNKCRKMKADMMQYLRDYPLESEKDMSRLKRLGMTQEDVHRIIQSKNDVLRFEKCSEQDWLKRFDSAFLSELDRAAMKRIKRYSLDTGVKTAAFPVSFIDAAVVLMNSYLMIGDLCRIYRLRSKPGFTLIIFGWSFFHTLAASRLGDLTEEGAETLFVSIEAELESGVVNFFGRKIAPKITEGAINGLIIRVLGRQAQRRLKPLHIVD